MGLTRNQVSDLVGPRVRIPHSPPFRASMRHLVPCYLLCMLIKENSILKTLPTDKLGASDLYYLEAVVTLVAVLERHYKKLFDLLSAEKVIADESIIVEVWGIIGSYRKLECILNQCPGLKKKDPQIQLYLKSINKAENLRHFIEHYNGEIKELYDNTKPPFGHLSFAKFVDEKNINVQVIVPGYVRKFKGLQMVNPVGKEFRNEIDLVMYYFGNLEIDLSDLFYKTLDFIPLFENFIEVSARDTLNYQSK
jgi:hypothetical protein